MYNYIEFKKHLIEAFEKTFTEKEIEIVDENGEERISIFSKESNSAVTSSVNLLYKAYSNGYSINNITEEMNKAYSEFMDSYVNTTTELSFDSIKDNVIFDVRNYGDLDIWSNNYLYKELSGGLSMIFAI